MEVSLGIVLTLKNTPCGLRPRGYLFSIFFKALRHIACEGKPQSGSVYAHISTDREKLFLDEL
jgi:hypothetical protein